MVRKRFLCLALALSTLLPAAFTGCKKNTDGASSASAKNLKPVSLKYYYFGVTQPGEQQVYDAVNKILKDKLNLTMSFIKIPNNGDYTQKMSVMISAQEEFDLCFTSPDYLNYFDNSSKGNYVDLTKLLPKYAPKTYAQFKPEIWNAAKVNGKLYASINQQIFARQAGYVMKKDYVDKYKFDYKSVKKLSDLAPYLALVKAGEPADKTDQLMNASMKSHVFSYLYPNYSWETIGGTDVPGVAKSTDKKPAVFNEYDTPEFKDFITTLADFQSKGYIAKDALTRPAFDQSKYAAASLATYMPGIETTLKTSYKSDQYVVPLGKPLLTTYGAIATMTAVSSTSKNPERAVMYLEEINNNKELYNLLCHGIEGVDYTKTGTNRIEVSSTAKYIPNTDWMFGNQFNSFVSGTQPDDVWEQTKKLNDSATISNLYGFNFDPSSVKTEIANCSAVVNEFKANFNTGMYGANTAAKLTEFLSKLKAAGVDKVIAAKQKQIDAFLAAKK